MKKTNNKNNDSNNNNRSLMGTKLANNKDITIRKKEDNATVFPNDEWHYYEALLILSKLTN